MKFSDWNLQTISYNILHLFYFKILSPFGKFLAKNLAQYGNELSVNVINLITKLFCKSKNHEDKQSYKKKEELKKFPTKTIKILDSWLQMNIDCPFPTKEDKELLAIETNLTYNQVSTWFANIRKRKLKYILVKK